MIPFVYIQEICIAYWYCVLFLEANKHPINVEKEQSLKEQKKHPFANLGETRSSGWKIFKEPGAIVAAQVIGLI